MHTVGDGMQEMVLGKAWDKFFFSQYGTESICGESGKVFYRKGWQSSAVETSRIWKCSKRYKVKGVLRCSKSSYR